MPPATTVGIEKSKTTRKQQSNLEGKEDALNEIQKPVSKMKTVVPKREPTASQKSNRNGKQTSEDPPKKGTKKQ